MKFDGLLFQNFIFFIILVPFLTLEFFFLSAFTLIWYQYLVQNLVLVKMVLYIWKSISKEMSRFFDLNEITELL